MGENKIIHNHNKGKWCKRLKQKGHIMFTGDLSARSLNKEDHTLAKKHNLVEEYEGGEKAGMTLFLLKCNSKN